MTKEQMIAHARALQEIVSDEEMARRVGEQIAQLLQLKRKRNGRYDTSGGDKTDCGLGRTVARVIADTLTDSTPSMTAREADKRDLQALGAWGIQR